MFRVRLNKESFKFSSAHFTIFDEVRAERLHGHNYYVSVDISFATLNEKTSMTADFRELKEAIQSECDFLDEYVLLPEQSPYARLDTRGEDIHFQFKDKNYSFPQEDVRILPVANITCESLSHHLAQILKKSWQQNKNVLSLVLTVSETHGQAVSTTLEFGERQ